MYKDASYQLSKLWKNLFCEVKCNSEGVFFSSTNLLAGDDGSGKTTLMAKIQGAEHGKKGRGLEYLYLNIHDEDRDGKFVSSAISLNK